MRFEGFISAHEAQLLFENVFFWLSSPYSQLLSFFAVDHFAFLNSNLKKIVFGCFLKRRKKFLFETCLWPNLFLIAHIDKDGHHGYRCALKYGVLWLFRKKFCFVRREKKKPALHNKSLVIYASLAQGIAKYRSLCMNYYRFLVMFFKNYFLCLGLILIFMSSFVPLGWVLWKE